MDTSGHPSVTMTMTHDMMVKQVYVVIHDMVVKSSHPWYHGQVWSPMISWSSLVIHDIMVKSSQPWYHGQVWSSKMQFEADASTHPTRILAILPSCAGHVIGLGCYIYRADGGDSGYFYVDRSKDLRRACQMWCWLPEGSLLRRKLSQTQLEPANDQDNNKCWWGAYGSKSFQ